MIRGATNAKRILVLHAVDDVKAIRPCVRQHLLALESSPCRHQILYHHTQIEPPYLLRRIRFDAVILHTTALWYRWNDACEEQFKKLEWLKSLPSLKIAIPQDEYNYAEILDDWLDEFGVSVICTNFDHRFRAILYPKMHARARFVRCLTGYIDEAAAQANAPARPAHRRTSARHCLSGRALALLVRSAGTVEARDRNHRERPGPSARPEL